MSAAFEGPVDAEAPSSGEPAAPTPQQRFVDLLDDRGRQRTRGLVVAVRGTTSLAGLQDVAGGQIGVGCLTARYRLSEPLLGSAFAAFVDDMVPNPADEGVFEHTVKGDLRAGRPEKRDPWHALRRGLSGMAAPLRDGAEGELDAHWLDRFFAAVAAAVAERGRLVLFVEMDRPGGAWSRTQVRQLAERMPRRLGLVLTWPEHDIDLGSSLGQDPHVLDLRLPQEGSFRLLADFVDAPLTGDQLADVDTLDRGWYAAALANLVMLPETGPMTIGIHASWGGGKSSFMRFVRWELLRLALAGRPGHLDALAEANDRVQQAMRDTAELDQRRRLAEAIEARAAVLDDLESAASDQVICVRFNAWLYEGSTQIWAGLTHEITAAMERSQNPWQRLRTRVRYALLVHGAAFWVGVAAAVLAAVLLSGAALVLGFGRAGQSLAASLPVGLEVVAKLLPAGSVVAVGLLLAWRLSRGFLPVSGRVVEYLRQPDYRQHMGYQHQMRRDLDFLKARLRSAGGRPPRVVVFVDDLDRCSDEKVLETLQAITLLLTESGFYVFLGIDTDVIVRAIERRYRATSDEKEDAPQRARAYLDKILQLNVPLRQPDPVHGFDFLSGFFSAASRRDYQAQRDTTTNRPPAQSTVDGLRLDWRRVTVTSPPQQDYQVHQVEDTPDELAAFDALQSYLPRNPRELKRLVNVHRLLRLLVRHGNDRPGPAQRRLAVGWLLFCFTNPAAAEAVVAQARTSDREPDGPVEHVELQPFVWFPMEEETATLTAGQLLPGTPLGEIWEVTRLFQRHAAAREGAREAG